MVELLFVSIYDGRYTVKFLCLHICAFGKFLYVIFLLTFTVSDVNCDN